MASEDRQSDLAVMDAEEFQQKRLLARIIEGRERVTELANKARERYIGGEIDQRGRNTMLLWAVQDYISTCWTLLRSYAEQEDDEYYLLEADLGSIEFGTGEEDNVSFQGLYDILTAEEVHTSHFTEVVEYPQGPPRERTRTETKSVPRQVSWRACRLLDEFLANTQGIELVIDEIDTGLQSFGFDTVNLDKDELGVETIEDIEAAIESDVDARVLQNGSAENGEKV